MEKKGGRILVIIGLIGSLIFLFQSIDLAIGQQPYYPTKPITFFIAYGAGGSTDIASRAFCAAASKYLGQPFIPINKPGAGGVIAAVAVMNAKPDGYTLGSGGPSSSVTAPLSGEAPYKDITGFTPIAGVWKYVFPLIVRGDSPWKTWGELMEWARKNPRATKVSITGVRSTTTFGHMLWQAEKREKVEFTYIPLKSSAETLSAILGGHITLYGSTTDASTIQYVKEKKLRILAYMDMCKVSGFENIPSFQELYGFPMVNYHGVWGPQGLPDNVLEKLEDTFTKAAVDPDFVKVMKPMHMPIVYMNRIELKKYLEEMTPKVAEIMNAIRAEEAKEKK